MNLANQNTADLDGVTSGTRRLLKQTLDTIASKTVLSKIAINIGACCGKVYDPLYELYTKFGFGGLCLEIDPAFLPKLQSNLPESVDKVIAKITPDNALTFLRDYQEIDIISIDIDSYDYFILKQVISLRPKVVIIELNENIPPGISYAAKYSEEYDYSIKDGGYQLFGCSLDMVTSLGKQNGYRLLKMEWNNAILIDERYSDLFDLPVSNEEAYAFGYYFRENMRKIFYWKGEESTYFNYSTQEAFKKAREFFVRDLDKIILEYTD